MAQVSQQVMKHNFLTVILHAAVGQTLWAKLNQPGFQRLLTLIQRSADASPEVCEEMWDQVGKYNGWKKRDGFQLYFPLFL